MASAAASFLAPWRLVPAVVFTVTPRLVPPVAAVLVAVPVSRRTGAPVPVVPVEPAPAEPREEALRVTVKGRGRGATACAPCYPRRSGQAHAHEQRDRRHSYENAFHRYSLSGGCTGHGELPRTGGFYSVLRQDDHPRTACLTGGRAEVDAGRKPGDIVGAGMQRHYQFAGQIEQCHSRLRIAGCR